MRTAALLGAAMLGVAIAGTSIAVTPTAVPQRTGPVVDTAGVIDAVHAQTIEALARELQSKTGAEIALLTVDSSAPLTSFDYGMAVLDSWKLGRTKRDDGLLLLVAV